MNLIQIAQEQNSFFLKGNTRSYSFRIQQLKTLLKAVKKYENEIIQALNQDFGKSAFESYFSEIGITYADIKHTIKHLKKWMREEHYASPIALFPSFSKVVHEPHGKCYIIAPWNYPFQLVVTPLIAAIAGGNTALLKPSELTPRTTDVLEKMIAEFFNPNYIALIKGDGAEISELVFRDYQPDFVFFTGSPTVGSIIAQRAAKDLIPYTLELGGKSPAIVDESANIPVAAKRILWGKIVNAGQTCIAPDYVLVKKSVREKLIQEMKAALDQWYSKGSLLSDDFASIINSRRFEKLKSYLQKGEILYGGQSDDEKFRIALTLMDAKADSEGLMTEEIFGPILPIITFENNQEAMEIIHKNPNPLALYIFTKNKKNEAFFSRNIAFGGGCINNTLVHIGNAHLPFGGVRSSGIGSYHGRAGFMAFTHAKSLVKTGTWLDIEAKYPPYSTFKDKLIRFLFK